MSTGGSLFVAVPAYDGTVHVDTVRSLLNEQIIAEHAGLEFKVVFLPGCSLITMARNQIVADFLASEADKLIFVDSDVSWEPGSLVKLASHKVDLVGGAYRLKQDAEIYPVDLRTDGRELWAVDGLLEIDTLPGGFLCCTRRVFDDLKVAHPERGYSHYEFSGHAYFHAPFDGGRLWGEDSRFCYEYRQTGGKVWLDPELSLTHHAGMQAYPGHIGNWLRGRINDDAG
jgi:hypothetical protein